MSEISNEYAKALYMLAIEKGCKDEYKTALETVSGIFNDNPQYAEFLSTFAIPLNERLNAIETAFSNDIPRDIVSFIKILCEKKHITEFTECADKYIEMYNELDKVSNAKVTSAVELTEKEKEAVKAKLEASTGRNRVMEYIVDKSIIGGLIIETDGKIMDSSLKKQLKDVKEVIQK